MPQKFYLDEIILHALVAFGKAWKCTTYYMHLLITLSNRKRSTMIPARYGTLCGVTSNLSLKHSDTHTQSHIDHKAVA